MRTKFILLALVLVLSLSKSYSQLKIEVVANDMTIDQLKKGDNEDIKVTSTNADLKSFTLRCINLEKDHTLKIEAVGETFEYKNNNVIQTFTFKENLFTNQITISHFNKAVEITEDKIIFKLIKDDTKQGSPPNETTTINIPVAIDQFLATNYSNYQRTPFGLIDPNDDESKVHLFFDHLGNNLLSTVPQGISNAQYVVHIIYPFTNNDPNAISYTVKQKSGSYSSALLFNNTGIKDNNPFKPQSGTRYDGISERLFLLGTSTDDLSFDIKTSTQNSPSTKTVLENYTIKMAPVYHGSFDIGLLRTNLSNPTYELTTLPGTTDKVVKLTNDSPKGVVTLMASFYTSPIILLEKAFGRKKIPYYKLTGRNFLDDHKFYERIYPTIGVGINDKSFENIFYGFNWEIARGLSIFGGWHYGKVNTFEKPNFTPNATTVTDEEFTFYKNTKWTTSSSFGIKVDLLIVTNLFGSAAAK